MSISQPTPCILHPAIARQTLYPSWTRDPAVAQLLAILRDLDGIGERLEALHSDRPDLGAAAMRSEIGGIARLYERTADFAFGEGWHIRANGGACAALWALLAQRRDAWIHAKLEVEGFPAHVASHARDARGVALAQAAASVEQAWLRFSAGHEPSRDAEASVASMVS